MQQGGAALEVGPQRGARMLAAMEQHTSPTLPRPAAGSVRAWREACRRLAGGLACLALAGSAGLGLASAPGAALAGPSAAGAAAATADPQAFMTAWRDAVVRPGGEAIAGLTAFPFLYEGSRLDRPAFLARVVPALFAPSARQCLRAAQPVAEDGRLVVSCAPYGYVFGPTPSGWRLIEFFVDTP